MSTSQGVWLAVLVSAICTALLGETELLTPREHHIVSLISVVATAVSGVMLRRPEALGGSAAYFVVKDGAMHKVDKKDFELHARVAGEEKRIAHAEFVDG